LQLKITDDKMATCLFSGKQYRNKKNEETREITIGGIIQNNNPVQNQFM
jgi:hypothetical protein